MFTRTRISLLLAALSVPTIGVGIGVEPAAADDPNYEIVNYWIHDDGDCLWANNSKEADAMLRNPGPGCYADDPTELWEWHPVTLSDGTRLWQIHYPYAAPDMCLSLEGIEHEARPSGTDVQVEACEVADDALWFRPASNRAQVRNWSRAHADLCLTPDMRDGATPNRSVQLEPCNSSRHEQHWSFETPYPS